MNIDLLQLGLICLLCGLLFQFVDERWLAKARRGKTWGRTEGGFVYSKWMLLIGGTLVTIYALFSGD